MSVTLFWMFYEVFEMTFFEDIFKFRKKEKLTGADVRWIWGWGSYWAQKLCDGEGSVTWGVVMIEHTFVCNISSYAFSWAFWGHPYKKTWLTVCPGGTNSVWTIASSVAGLMTFLPHLVYTHTTVFLESNSKKDRTVSFEYGVKPLCSTIGGSNPRDMTLQRAWTCS